MGARQSKRSVDISSTPKKEVDGQAPEKLEKLDEGDVIKVQNGTAPHSDTAKEESPQEDGAGAKDTEAATPVTEKADAPAAQGEGDVSPATEAAASSPTTGEAEKKDTTPTTPEGEKADEKAKSEEKSDKKKKEKSKKKWSFRSISFSKKDKPKPSMSRDESKSNDLAKEAPVPEEGAVKSGSEETSPSEPEATSPATEEVPKESTVSTTTTTVIESKEEAPAGISSIDIKSVVTTISSAAESGVQNVVEETTKLVSEAKEALSTIVETGSKLIVEESKTTTVTESSSIIKTSTKTIEIVEETIAPPLPASPPPTEAPPPTPVAPQAIQQHEHEEMNGGGESMAEMPEENGLCENEKIDDLHDDLPKMNGHNESPVQQVEEITECLLKTSIEDKVILENHLEIAVEDGQKD